MQWTIIFHDEFEPEFDELPTEVQDELYAEAGFVERFGPETGRPHVDTLKGSDYANMKELRIQHAGRPYRVLFAFDPRRCAILLLGGDKTGNARWYDENIPVADKLFEGHLRTLERERTHGREGAKHDKEFQ